MSEIVKAIYENGILRPLEPLALREHQTVRLQILDVANSDDAEQIIQDLVGAGILTPPKGYSDVESISDEEQQKIAQILGETVKKLSSEMIIEDRGEW